MTATAISQRSFIVRTWSLPAGGLLDVVDLPAPAALGHANPVTALVPPAVHSLGFVVPALVPHQAVVGGDVGASVRDRAVLGRIGIACVV